MSRFELIQLVYVRPVRNNRQFRDVPGRERASRRPPPRPVMFREVLALTPGV